MSFVVVPGGFSIAAGEHFVVVGVFLFVSCVSAEVFFSDYQELWIFYKIDLNAQIGSRRNLQEIEGFATNRITIRQNVFAILFFMTFSFNISAKKVKMGIAL